MTAVQDHTIAGSGYGNVYLDSLVWGNAGWNVGSGPISYWFGSKTDVASVPNPAPGFTASQLNGWDKAEIKAFEIAVGLYSSVCGLTFEKAVDAASANVVWWQVPEALYGAGVLGVHEVPGAGWRTGGGAQN